MSNSDEIREKVKTAIKTGDVPAIVKPVRTPPSFNGRVPTKCRVKLQDRLPLALVGGGSSAFDADFDWETMTAHGVVEGHDVLVHITNGNITFKRDQE